MLKISGHTPEISINLEIFKYTHAVVADFQQACIDLDERVIFNTDWLKFKSLVKTAVRKG